MSEIVVRIEDFLAKFVVWRDIWYAILNVEFGLIGHMLFWVILGSIVRRLAGRPQNISVDAAAGLSITMYAALLADLADKGLGITILLKNKIAVGTLCFVLLRGFLQELVDFFKNILPPRAAAPQPTTLQAQPGTLPAQT
jgi:hypothetical protein